MSDRSTSIGRALNAAAASDAGLHREVNEDRLLCDPSRGLFIVIDGVGGQAAGGRAADIALTTIRTRLERETGTVIDRVAEAITIANNEILRCGSARAEWHGMACVLTVVVVDEGRAIVGHVGDTRLYRLTEQGIEKVTRDHSPIGEREDARQISELEAMQHPRRNEVYRDVGSEPHQADDADFIEVHEIPFEPDTALLLCSDGLTDLVASARIWEDITKFAGQPDRLVGALIDEANTAGGRDNITVVYVEGEQFASSLRNRPQSEPEAIAAFDSAAARSRTRTDDEPIDRRETGGSRRGRLLTTAIVGLLMLLAGIALAHYRPDTLVLRRGGPPPPSSSAGSVEVAAGGLIGAALERAQAGSTILVEPGEYHERVTLRNGVRLISRVPRAAVIRLPGGASERDAAVVAAGVHDAEFTGFRIVGDAATPLGTGVLIQNSAVSIVDVEVTGATKVAIDIGASAPVSVAASDIRDNPGAALAIRSGSLPRIVHNVFARNGLTAAATGTIVIEDDVEAYFSGNVFYGVGRGAFRTVDEPARSAFVRDNWFPDSEDLPHPSSGDARGRRGR